MKNFRIATFSFLAVLFVISCDAPRINPLDSENPDYNKGVIDGFVKTSVLPRQSIAGVKVYLKKQNLMKFTDAEGYYRFEETNKSDDIIYFEIEGYNKDSASVVWNRQSTKRIGDMLLSANIGVIDGYVKTSLSPFSPINNVKVYLKNQNLIKFTDANGYYKFEHAAQKDDVIYFEAEGFNRDSSLVVWDRQSTNRIADMFLRANIGVIDGYVKTSASPFRPINNVKVYLKNQNLIKFTDTNGFYKFEHAAKKDDVIYFEAEGFNRDSSLVVWDVQNSKHMEDKFLNFIISGISGNVKTEAFPREGINGVKVFWKNQGMLVQTNYKGEFEFKGLKAQNGWLYFEKEGYSPDSSFVQIVNQQSVHIEVFLNRIPQMDDLKIYTIVSNYSPDRKIYELVILTQISDAENDVDSIFVQSDELNFKRQLNYNPSSRMYEATMDPAQLKLVSIEEAIGKNFVIMVKDKSRKIFNVGHSSIKRIIKQEVTPRFPLNDEVVSKTFMLMWNRFEPGFSCKYKTQIFTRDLNRLLVWESGLIPGGDIQISPPSTLSPGEYLWIIWCIDDYQNTSKSKPVSFVIQ